MKLLIIYPYCLEARVHEEDISIVPMGAYYVAALLMENHYDVEILNWYNFSREDQRIKDILAEKKPDVIGFSVLHANRWGGIEIARMAKQVNPNVKIVFGGIGATFLWEHFLTHFKEIDFVVIGEGEHAFLNLVKCIENKDHEQIEKIRGIAFKKEDKVVKTASAEFIHDLDELPIPAKYFTYQHVALTRGCPGNCTFCGSPQFWGRKVRFHSSDYFVDQLELLYKRGVGFFYFSDDTFTLKKDRVIEICKKIIERNINISWAAISRVDHISEDILYWMKKAGCIQISYGVESGSEKIRKQLNKNIKTDQIKKAFSLTTAYGILARAYFIYGCPGESWDTIQETIDLINEIKPLSAIFYILDIFPGTALYADFKKRTKENFPFTEGDRGNFDDIWLKQIEDILYFESDPHLSQEIILAYGKKLRTTYYESLYRFADEIELTDNKELYMTHSDFLSKLGMTFTHGDYSQIEAIKHKDKIAERLYQKSLTYYPDHRAYLGLGIIKQKNGEYEESVSILSKGIEYFPDSEPLHMCSGISYMNLGKYAEALPYFLKLRHSKDAAYYIEQCHKALKNT
ncbi:B12-binding domain-containing radical SAM protein [Desulfonema magnum]|uniref:Cobalamin-binding radical SAM domain protein n=1 Tax=Desulfonema magnum TaxID=45655 RepID=A0A975BWJ8_9BACT|nr:radical SAM protein [Desulfonema magnum]QTA93110.1 Cobalamin-binding radical SAM domain protein [Desulfonema magnum]